MTPLLKSRGGFSLMEVLIAILLLAGVGAMTMYAFSSSTQATQPGASVAYNFGRSIMEEMHERVRQDQWPTANLPLSLSNPGPQGQIKSLNSKTYTANYTVTTQDANVDGQEDFRRVRMTVSW